MEKTKYGKKWGIGICMIGLLLCGLAGVADRSYAASESTSGLAQEPLMEEVATQTDTAKSGFVTQNGYLFYFDPQTGQKVTGFRTINGNTYYFYPTSGAALSGYQIIDGKAYYFDTKTYIMKTGIIEIQYSGGAKKHYFLKEGGLASGWVTDNGKRYYFSSPETGSIMLTGVQNIDGTLYYFDSTTGEQKEGIYPNNQGKYYYYAKEGGVKTGLQEWNGNLYYLKELQSGEVQYGMQSVGSNLYYFDPNTGAAWKNQTFTYAGLNFQIGADGNVTSITIQPGYENNLWVKLIKNGMDLLGQPYSFNKNEGYACGYFVQCMFETIGIEIPTASYQQAQAVVEGNLGRQISESELRVGDLIFWSLNNCTDANCQHWNEIHHVAIYLGNGKLLESSEPRGGVVVQDIRSYDNFEIQYYARLLEDTVGECPDATLPVYKSPVKAPASTTGLKAVSAGKNKVTLTWTAVDGAQGYLIYAQKSGKYGYCGMTKSTSYTDTKALDLDYNFYWVFPYVTDSVSNKMVAGGCTKYVYAKGILPAPQGLKAQSVTGGVKLTWSKVEGADGYIIYGIRGDNAYGYIGMTTTATTFTDKKALKNAYNFYWVFPYHNGNGDKKVTGFTAKYVYGKAK